LRASRGLVQLVLGDAVARASTHARASTASSTSASARSNGPGREVQRVGRVVLGPHGISFGRLDILLITLAVDAGLHLVHFG
jgi:hypothetical protein